MKKNLTNILGILTVLIAVVGLYPEYKNQNLTLEVKTIVLEKLTGLPVIDGLKASYKYNGNDVHSLWRIHYIIKNTGNEIIIGEGNKKNIIKNNLTFSFGNGFKILELDKKSKVAGSPFSLLVADNKVNVSFLQWKPQESFELIVYSEQVGKGIFPTIKTNEREIINGKVEYTNLNNVNKKYTLYSKLPSYIKNILYWASIIVYGLIILLIPIVWLGEVKNKIKFNSWEKANLPFYNEWVDALIESDELAIYHSPKELPKHIWDSFEKEKPASFPDNDFNSTTFIYIIFLAISAVPLMLLIEI